MQKIVKLSAALATTGVSMALLATAAFASDSNVVNTGDHVTVDNGSTTSSSVSVTNNNNATISQSSFNNANTGDNTANRNIGDTSIHTGNATVNNVASANANANVTSVSNIGGGSNNSTTATNTGDNLLLFGNGDNSTNVSVNNNNTAHVSQSAYNNVNTGDNTANRNIGGTSITTGAANVSNVFGAQVNGNVTSISGVGSNNSSNSLDLVNTGDDVTVGCSMTPVITSFLFDQPTLNGCGNSTSVDVTNNNSADIHQSSFNDVNTGDNTANRNISGADLFGVGGADASIMTGTATVGNLFSAAANGNWTAINGAGLSNGGDNSDVITNTGDNLNVFGGNSVVSDVSVTNNNGAQIYQSSFNNANTGHDTANRNIDLSGAGTGISTGNAGFASAFLAGANWNWTMVGGNATMPGMFSWWTL